MTRNYTALNAIIDGLRAAPMTVYGAGLSYMTTQTMDGMPDAGKLTAGAFALTTAAAGIYSSILQFKQLRKEQAPPREKLACLGTEYTSIAAAGAAGAITGNHIGGAETAVLVGTAAASIPAVLVAMPALSKPLEERI